MSLLFGRFHPLLVHMPIGILIVALFFEWLSRRERFRMLQPAVHYLLLTGALVAILSCFSGYLLSLQNDYQEDLLDWHLAMGISTAVISSGLYFIRRSPAVWAKKIYTSACVGLFLVLSVTGHLGGSLTHGSTYLTDALPGVFKDWFSGKDDSKVIANVQNAFAYADIIHPLLQQKCGACHGESKQKGGLRLDVRDAILKGGKKGKVMIAGNPFESEMIKRIYLPVDDDHHMPPRGKGQVTPAEAQLLQWWIAEGADFEKKVADLPQPEMMRAILTGLQSSDPDKTIFASHNLPEDKVDDVPDSVRASFRGRGITLVPVGRGSNFLSASFVALPQADDETVKLLLPVAKNLVELKLGNTRVTDKAMTMIGKFPNLMSLGLAHTAVTDAGLSALGGLKELTTLNLVGTDVSARGIAALKPMAKLRHVFLYQTKISDGDWAMLKKEFPGVSLDRGGYEVPTWESDTTKVTEKKK